MTRFPDLTPENMTTEQRRVYDNIIRGPRGRFGGPFNPLLRSPEICDLAQKMGAFIRFEGRLPGKLRELAILVVARHWRAQYEWYVHSGIAVDEGLASEVVDAIAANTTPFFADPAEEAVYRFCRSMMHSGEVSDEVFTATQGLLGEDDVMELVGLLGFYCLISFALNAAQVPAPDGFMPLA